MSVMMKCKMCGGNLEIQDGARICVCEFCGTQQTVPGIENDKKLVLFERANKLRFDCEFDQAQAVYENIISEYPDEAEAYWGLILSRYGIEYVDDPKTGKKIPTCHRISHKSIYDDDDFLKVVTKCDKEAKDIYYEEVKVIDAIREKIINISNKEQPYDVFICYKESDENGERTEDSVLAEVLYEELTKKKYRVFFAKISLEDKLGKEFEPYIFAALNSAKVMLVVGTREEYFNAVWVRNEWSRFLDIIKRDKEKALIPCYKGIDPYDLPKEFNGLQAQDLGKVGSYQDIVRGVGKIIPKGSSVPTSAEDIRDVIKQENKKRTIRNTIIISVAGVAVAVALVFGVRALVEMIKNNKSETVVNNYLTEATSEATTEATTEAPKEYKYRVYINDSEDGTGDKSTIAGGVHPIYVHYDITDGPWKEPIQFKVECIFPNGEVSTNISDEIYGPERYGAYASFFWKNDDTGEMVDLPKGSYSISVYVVSTGECVKAKTITVD